MVPLAALLAPLYLIVKDLGLLNTYWGLILPMAVSPLGVFMMRQFIATLPEGSTKRRVSTVRRSGRSSDGW